MKAVYVERLSCVHMEESMDVNCILVMVKYLKLSPITVHFDLPDCVVLSSSRDGR